jgi:hypothetical protein
VSGLVSSLVISVVVTRTFSLRRHSVEAADKVDDARRLFVRWSAADRHVFPLVDLAAGMLALARQELEDALRIAAATTTYHHPIAPLALALLGETQAAVGDVTGAHDTASSQDGSGRRPATVRRRSRAARSERPGLAQSDKPRTSVTLR